MAGSAIFAQSNIGISVQGIARDAMKAAIVDELLTFTFEIKDESGVTSYYKEDVDIRTDPYGVFSHIIGTGNILAGSGDFREIPFRQIHMKLIISVNYNGSNVVISNNPFQYAPYAISAFNGVPTGTIVAFAATDLDIPDGWVLCDGQDLTLVEGSINLRNLIGDNAPDLRGMFLRGTGTSPVNGEDGPTLGATQDDGFEAHNHPASTAAAGNHTHTTEVPNTQYGFFGFADGSAKYYRWNYTGAVTSSSDGNHTHTVSVSNTGTNETRPVNYGVNYIIKL